MSRAIDPAIAVPALVRMTARKAVIHQLQAQGLKPAQRTFREIAVMAEEYIAKHRAELVADVRERYAKLLSDAQRKRR